jgi:hypothetical protein
MGYFSWPVWVVSAPIGFFLALWIFGEWRRSNRRKD